MDRSSSIFGNQQPKSVTAKANKTQKRYTKKFGDDSQVNYPLKSRANPILKPYIGVENLEIGQCDAHCWDEKGIIVGNIRMGYGHYRISMAIASAANHLGYTPYWFDLNAYQQTTGGKVINHLNKLYSLGSRLSQKYSLFNKLYWEKLNSEGFRKLSYNAMDQKVTELMTPVYRNLPKQMPFIATHTWPAQAAIHAGMDNVINIVPDNWPMALHLAEGAKHLVQTPSSYFGYRMLKGMDGDKALHPMPAKDIHYVGHFIDHELLADLHADCEKRIQRANSDQAMRVLLTIGGAGAQFDTYKVMIKKLLPMFKQNKVCLMINVGDYKNVWDKLCEEIPELEAQTICFSDDWQGTQEFANMALSNNISGVYAFHHSDIYCAVYTTNLLIRATDIMVTKPSELAFYPVPKLMIKRVGGHEAYGALRAAEVGDGTIEFNQTEAALAMLEVMLEDSSVLEMMCTNILKAHSIGIYDGAYRAVEMAVNK